MKLKDLVVIKEVAEGGGVTKEKIGQDTKNKAEDRPIHSASGEVVKP